MCLATAGPAPAATITVNSTADAAGDDGACTLREAITAANGNAASGALVGECAAGDAQPVADTVEFSIAGSGPHTIAPASLLPAITEVVTLDGGTDLAPGPGADEIVVDGAAVNGAGLDVEADDVAVRNLTLTRFLAAIDLAGTSGAEVSDSFIGTNQDGDAGLGGGGGIRLGVVSAPAVGATIRSSVIASNSLYGVFIADSDSAGNTIAGNKIGTGPNGVAALPNFVGIRVFDAPDDTTIGGPLPADRNIISGNTETGIEFSGTSPGSGTGTLIQNNRIGTGFGGEQVIPNGLGGITLSGSLEGAVVRDNLISGNDAHGIVLGESGAPSAAPTATTIAGNLIGTDKDGIEPLGNEDGGISLSAPTVPLADTVIGGTGGLTAGGDCTGDCNVIADNGSSPAPAAVTVVEATGTEVLGNHIGADATGLAPLENEEDGISVFAATGTRIGSAAAPNVIATQGDGVFLELDTTGTSVQGNLMGIGADGQTPLALGGSGVWIRNASSGNAVGGSGAGEGNVIAGSGETAVRIEDTSTANPILGNSIYDSNSLGIELLPGLGPNTNDPVDADGGANDLQNHPILAAAVADGGETLVVGALHTKPATGYRIEAFANELADPSGYGEGQTPLGAFEVTTDASGDASFAEAVAQAAAPGNAISATATELDPLGAPLSTSEFSENVTEGCDILGTVAGETIAGTAAAEVLCGFGGDDVIEPGGGNDVIIGGDGADRIDLSAADAAADLDLAAGAAAFGTDQLALVGIEDATGTAFDDELRGDGSGNALDGGSGADVLVGGSGADELDGGGGADDIDGEGGSDTLKGSDGADALDGGDGADTLLGGGGADDLKGRDGGDTLKGQDGGDSLKGSDGKDTLKGGDGNDTLKGQNGADTVKGGDGKDTLKGQDGSDKLRGDKGADTLKGGAGSDDLKGGDGKDSLNGGSGGKDVCNGGGGRDKRSASGCETKRSIP